MFGQLEIAWPFVLSGSTQTYFKPSSQQCVSGLLNGSAYLSATACVKLSTMFFRRRSATGFNCTLPGRVPTDSFGRRAWDLPASGGVGEAGAASRRYVTTATHSRSSPAVAGTLTCFRDSHHPLSICVFAQMFRLSGGPVVCPGRYTGKRLSSISLCLFLTQPE